MTARCQTSSHISFRPSRRPTGAGGALALSTMQVSPSHRVPDQGSVPDARQLSAPEQSLAEAGIPQLYGSLHSDDANKVDDSITIALDAPPSSPTQDIITLTRAILLNFLSLIQLLAADPTQADAKVADLQNLFYNVHHLINLYRPHQARESLIAMLEEQIQRKRALVERVRVVKERVGKVLGEVQALTAVAGQAGGDGTAISAKAEPTATSTPLHMDGVTNDVHRRQQKQKDAWTRLQLAV